MRVTLPKVCLVLGLALFSAFLVPHVAEAGGLKANLILSSVDPSRTAKSEKQLRSSSKSVKKLTDGSWEKGGEATPYDDRVFKAYLVTSFNQPPGDLEFHIIFYDVTDGGREFVDDMSTFIDKRDQKAFVTKLTLPRKRFRPNRKMELVVTVKRQEVGSIKFMTEGKEKVRDGVVNF